MTDTEFDLKRVDELLRCEQVNELYDLLNAIPDRTAPWSIVREATGFCAAMVGLRQWVGYYLEHDDD